MSSAYSEEVLCYGENNRGFGILCLSSKTSESPKPLVVMFNAGLLHRSEPYRLNTELARQIASLGYDSLRFDLSGKGDTPSRDGLSNRESVARDWCSLKASIEKRLGPRTFILMGLCSGADNAIKTAASDASVKGLVLLDPLPPIEHVPVLKRLIQKLSNPWFWLRAPFIVLRGLFGAKGRRKQASSSEPSDQIRQLPEQYELRCLPSSDELYRSICQCAPSAGVFCFFTSYSYQLYNSEGQIRRVLDLDSSVSAGLQEKFDPSFDHLLSVAEQRNTLLAELGNWFTHINFTRD